MVPVPDVPRLPTLSLSKLPHLITGVFEVSEAMRLALVKSSHAAFEEGCEKVASGRCDRIELPHASLNVATLEMAKQRLREREIGPPGQLLKFEVFGNEYLRFTLSPDLLGQLM
jgi:hypothetical protein